MRCFYGVFLHSTQQSWFRTVTSWLPATGWAEANHNSVKPEVCQLRSWTGTVPILWISESEDWVNGMFCFLLWFSFCFILQNATSRVTGTFPAPAGYYGDNYSKQPKLSWSMQFPHRRMPSNITSISVPRLCHCVRVKHLSCLFTLFLRRARFEKSEVPRGQTFSFPMSDLEIWKCTCVKTMHLFIFSPLFLKMERKTSCIPKNRD